MFFVERSITLCPYLGGSTVGGSTVDNYYTNNNPCALALQGFSSLNTRYNFTHEWLGTQIPSNNAVTAIDTGKIIVSSRLTYRTVTQPFPTF